MAPALKSAMYFRLSLFILVAFSVLLCSGERISTSYSGAIQLAAPALQAHWKLDDLSTHYQTAVDEVAGQDGLLMGVSSGDWDVGLEDTFAVDGFSMQASTASADGYVLLPSAPFDAVWNAGAWSLDFWVRLETLPSLLTSSLGCGTTFTAAVSASGKLSVSFGSAEFVSSASVVSAGDWAYVTIDVTNEGDLTVSVNGAEVGGAELSSTPTSSGCSVAFGRSASAGTIFDEIALHNASSTPWYRRSLYDTGISLGCRSVPCFSGVSCTSNGASSYTCGSCPTGFTGDGESCEVSPELRAAHRLGNCLPTATDLDNVFYCRDHCRSRRTCFLCGMYYSGPAMWAVRDACYVPSATPSVTASPSVSPSSTASSSSSPSVTASSSVSPSLTTSSSASPSLTPSTTATRSVTASLTASASSTASATVTPTTPICYDWVQMGADIDGEASEDESGYSVAINDAGDVVAIGAIENDGNGFNSGHVRVYEYSGGAWIQRGGDIDGEHAQDQSGFSVAINAAGSVVAVGAPYNEDVASRSGHVRVYEYIGGHWMQKGSDIDSVASNDRFGFVVSLNAAGDVLAVGATLGVTIYSPGEVRVYEYLGGNWEQKGSNITGETGDYAVYTMLNAAGNAIVVGSDKAEGNHGRVQVFEYTSGEWVQRGQTLNGETSGIYFGFSVSLDAGGEVLAVSELAYSGSFQNSGRVLVFEYNGSSWVQKGQSIIGFANEFSGVSASLNNDGSIIAVGSFMPSGVGLVRVFQFISDSWVQVGTDMVGEGVGDYYGFPVSLNGAGDRLASSGRKNDGFAYDSGHVRVLELDRVVCDP